MIGPFGRPGPAATLRQHCPQMTKNAVQPIIQGALFPSRYLLPWLPPRPPPPSTAAWGGSPARTGPTASASGATAVWDPTRQATVPWANQVWDVMCNMGFEFKIDHTFHHCYFPDQIGSSQGNNYPATGGYGGSGSQNYYPYIGVKVISCFDIELQIMLK